MIKNFNEFIFENNLLLENEMIKKFNLEKEFQQLNRTLFNDELPPIKLSWNRKKNSRGVFRYSIFKKGRLKKVIYDNPDYPPQIQISKFYNDTEENLRTILAHEMIHYWVWHNKLVDASDSHGKAFLKKMEEVNKKKIVTVSVYDESPTHQVADTEPLKSPIYALLITDFNTDKIFLNLITKSLFDKEIKKDPMYYMDFFVQSHLVNPELLKDIVFEIYEITDPNIKQFPSKRKLNYRKFSYIPVHRYDESVQQLMGEILEKSKLIYNELVYDRLKF